MICKSHVFVRLNLVHTPPPQKKTLQSVVSLARIVYSAAKRVRLECYNKKSPPFNLTKPLEKYILFKFLEDRVVLFSCI